jgi:hypothetical protein
LRGILKVVFRVWLSRFTLRHNDMPKGICRVLAECLILIGGRTMLAAAQS